MKFLKLEEKLIASTLMVWFIALWSVCAHQWGELDRKILFNVHSEPLQTSLPIPRFELTQID